MIDKIDVLDNYGIRTGEILSRKEIHKQGKVHRAVHLYLFNQENKLLLQRRSNNVDHYSGMFSISMTGHINSGESSSNAVKRELKEELGFDASIMKINFLFSFRQDVEINTTYIDRQFNDVYVCWADFKVEDITIEKSEISEIKMIDFSKFEEIIAQKDNSIVSVQPML